MRIWMFLTLFVLVAWIVISKLTYVPDPPNRYIPMSKKPLPLWLVTSVWTLTPIIILVWIGAAADIISGPKNSR